VTWHAVFARASATASYRIPSPRKRIFPCTLIRLRDRLQCRSRPRYGMGRIKAFRHGVINLHLRAVGDSGHCVGALTARVCKPPASTTTRALRNAGHPNCGCLGFTQCVVGRRAIPELSAIAAAGDAAGERLPPRFVALPSKAILRCRNRQTRSSVGCRPLLSRPGDQWGRRLKPCARASSWANVLIASANSAVLLRCEPSS